MAYFIFADTQERINLDSRGKIVPSSLPSMSNTSPISPSSPPSCISSPPLNSSSLSQMSTQNDQNNHSSFQQNPGNIRKLQISHSNDLQNQNLNHEPLMSHHDKINDHHLSKANCHPKNEEYFNDIDFDYNDNNPDPSSDDDYLFFSNIMYLF